MRVRPNLRCMKIPMQSHMTHDGLQSPSILDEESFDFLTVLLPVLLSSHGPSLADCGRRRSDGDHLFSVTHADTALFVCLLLFSLSC